MNNFLKTKVSILIPCYNSEKWIAKAIQSAFDQSHENNEVIVVDDGSTDGSVEQIKSFNDRIRFESGPNRGGNHARNRLLELAEGEWVQFLDADDYLKPNKIERQMGQSQHDIDVIYSPLTIETWNADQVADVSIHGPDPKHGLEEQWIRWQVAQTGSVLWRRSALQEIGGWNEDYPCCQDNEVTLRAIQAGLTFEFCPDAGAVYRIWSEETVCRKDPTKVIRFKTKLIDEMLAWLNSKSRLKTSHTKAAGQACFEMARSMAKFDLDKAAQYAKERKKVGLLNVVGPAGPFSFQLIAKTMGFRFAERLARWRRIDS